MKEIISVLVIFLIGCFCGDRINQIHNIDAVIDREYDTRRKPLDELSEIKYTHYPIYVSYEHGTKHTVTKAATKLSVAIGKYHEYVQPLLALNDGNSIKVTTGSLSYRFQATIAKGRGSAITLVSPHKGSIQLWENGIEFQDCLEKDKGRLEEIARLILSKLQDPKAEDE